MSSSGSGREMHLGSNVRAHLGKGLGGMHRDFRLLFAFSLGVVHLHRKLFHSDKGKGKHALELPGQMLR